MTSRDLTCRELVELVTDYLDDRLEPPERTRFEAHLAICAGCEAYLEQVRQTVGALGRLPDAGLSAETCDELLRAFRGWRGAS